jgi:ribosomal protein S18 acetylase RimI-like enzyme
LFKLENVTQKNFKDIPTQCRRCLYWQTSGEFTGAMLQPEMEKKKREWFSKAKKEFEGCLKIAYTNGIPIGFIQHASAKFFPRVKEYVAGPPSEDAIFIACLHIEKEEKRRKGLGTAMLKNLTAELKMRGFKAVETFARKSSADNPSGPLGFYLKHGFKVKNEKDDFPLVRLEL